MAERGRLVYLAAMGGAEVTLPIWALQAKRLRIQGSTLRNRALGEKLDVVARFAREVLPLLADGRVKPVVERVYPLDEISAAHEAMAANTNFGKLILTVE
jgi:NADPH:quinone reductase-like Zn-dependent oxidoreductase